MVLYSRPQIGWLYFFESEVMLMKMKTVFGIGLGAVILLGSASFGLANAANDQGEITPFTTVEQDTLCRDSENGLQISVDGNNWVSQSDYEQSCPKIEWWTASEYEKWMSEQRAELEALIGTGNGWYDGQGVYHEWTQESVDAEIAQYEETLKEIKAGKLYSKPTEDNISYAQIPPNADDFVSVYSIDFAKGDGSTIHIGDYETVDKLKAAIDNAVEAGTLTQEEANSVVYQ